MAEGPSDPDASNVGGDGAAEVGGPDRDSSGADSDTTDFGPLGTVDWSRWGASCGAQGPIHRESGVALGFDDDFVDLWFAQRELFRSYGARATFSVTRFDQLSSDEVDDLRVLQSDGHEIANHGLTHVSPRDYVTEHSVEAYLEDEIDPSMAAMRAAGFEPTAFSYPWGGRTDELDEALLGRFRVLRSSGRTDDPGTICYGWDGSRVVLGGSIDTSRTTLEAVSNALEYAQVNGCVLVLYGHRILEESTQSHTPPEMLESILAEIDARHLPYYTLSELPNRQLEPTGGTPEVIYDTLMRGSIEEADMLLEDIWPGESRYEPVYLGPELTWSEDPYGEKYWRFLFYSLRQTRHLLLAFQETGDRRYVEKLVDIVDSFLDAGMRSPYIDDKHTAAFLAMQLVNIFGKLARWCELDDDLARRMLEAIQDRGRFLARDEHFEPNNNHGVTEAAALLLITHNFPNLPEAEQWKALAIARLAQVVDRNVDADGVQIEQSPFYHFYVLNFFWQIFHWNQEYDIWPATDFNLPIDGMLRFATWMPQPDGFIPLIGSSIPYDIHNNHPALTSQMAAYDAGFRWVWSAGADGAPPSETSVLFPTAGWSIMRSSWGDAETFEQPTHLVFDVGPFRTGHSHLDALSVDLYARGSGLLIDSGLFSYEAGPEHDFFFGTSAHNTVVVDGADQAEGSCLQGRSVSGEDWSYQSGSHRLYASTLHRRAVILLGTEGALVVDRLSTEDGEVHRFEQLWHGPPEASLAPSGDAGARLAVDGGPAVVLEQLLEAPGEATLEPTLVEGQTEPLQGWVSSRYEEKVPAPVAIFTAEGEGADLVTLIWLEPELPEASATISGESVQVTIDSSTSTTQITLDGIALDGETVAIERPPHRQ